MPSTAVVYDTNPRKFRDIPIGGVIEEHRTTHDGKHEVRRGYRVASLTPGARWLEGATFTFKMGAGTHWCVDQPWAARHVDGVRIVPFEEWTREEHVRHIALTWKPTEWDTSPWSQLLMALVGGEHIDRIWPKMGDWPDETDALLSIARVIDANGGLPRCGDCRALIVDNHCACYAHRKAGA